MELIYKKAHSVTEPKLLDTTSSKTVTYVRKNVQQITKTDIDGNEYTEYEYDEATPSKMAYALYMVQESAGADNTTTQIAIAELAEQIEKENTSMQLAIAELAELVVK